MPKTFFCTIKHDDIQWVGDFLHILQRSPASPLTWINRFLAMLNTLTLFNNLGCMEVCISNDFFPSTLVNLQDLKGWVFSCLFFVWGFLDVVAVGFFLFWGGFFICLGFFCVYGGFCFFFYLDMSRIKWNIQNEDKTSVWILV